MKFKAIDFNEKLTAAVDSFDRQAAGELCNELLTHLRQRDDPYPLDHAKTVLIQLRRQRYFELMQLVADALIHNGQTGALIKRQYAQSQLDQGNLTAAISTLENLARDSAPGGADPNPEEYAEARGLLGRAYKDLYVLADNPNLRRNRGFLEKAIDYYRRIYEEDRSKVWQGINSVALIRRADADGVELDQIADLRLMAQSMATEILAKVKSRDQNRKADTWDFATAVEACIGLDQHQEALKWLQKYFLSQYASAFELGSTYRQLIQVWKLNSGEPPGDRILPALKGALLKHQGSEIELDVQEATYEKLDQLSEDHGYEKILGTEAFRSVKWFRKCMQRASAVAQVEDSVGDAVGTAFVVRGGDLKPELGDELLLLTNAHVVSTDPLVSRALRPDKAVIKFELWPDGESPEFKVEALWSSAPENLDATLMRPAPAISRVPHVPIAKTLPLTDGRQRAYIIGHPQGRKLSFSIFDNYLLDYDDRLLHYRSPTEPGNSGSPVLNEEWDLIGLHHRGLRNMPKLKGKEGTYPANEGIWIQAIVQALEAERLG
jgi:tetratricopeptide (TPR) repeat protein